ncbi:alpha-L-rhamnosidase C-terminal domain-containing protein [Lewinella sp. W8]|uniref:alpha-L-rhamnosidase-related protein n=1 Tax=Lewinella sp. W8 TaxID=2528208 RepID=UPI001067D48F|nr:alpha-L-rhamnosidase C-terminal domain-containing protein [Lewinella sp. W8]MTB50362.1 Bacterial alpha-L-rhamnosidase [Lewinella sp. W8]
MRFLLYLILVGYLLSCSVGEQITREPNTPSAQWITVPAFRDSSLANSWLVFEKNFDWSGADAQVPGNRSEQRRPVMAQIAADSKYWLWVNDSLVIREGGLKWGPVPGGYYVDSVDLSEHLRPGRNRVSVLVWYFGKDGFSHQNSGRAGLWFQAPRLGLVSDTSWMAGLHEAFSRNSGPPYPNYRLPESNVAFSAQNASPLYRADQTLYGYAGDLKPAISFSRDGRAVARPIPQWKDFGLQAYANAPTFPFTSDGTPLELQLPYNAQVTAMMTITPPANAAVDTLDVRTDNYRGGGPPNVRTIYLPRPGIKQTFESPGWFNGHHVIYTIPAGTVVHDLRFRETGYATEFTGAFSADDPFYNRLWDKARRTLYVTMRDNYMDCPDRERAQWWGDVVLESGETFYALDRSSDALTRKAIRELMDWQRPDSTIYSPVPAGNWDGELPTQMLASVGLFGIWNYYQHTGDADLIREVYPAVKRYLAIWQQDETGLVVPRKGGWTWGDWGDNKDMPLIFNGWYYLALRGLEDMAQLVGDQETHTQSLAKMKRLKKAFNEQFWTGEAYRSPAHQGPPDDRGASLAVVAGIAPKEYFPALRRVFAEQRHASPYFEKYVEEALFQMGYPEDALTRMKERFGPMVNGPGTTLWEGWEIGSAKYGGGTDNHAWSGGGLTLLSQYVAGVAPLEPGYRRVRIRPQLGPLQRVEATVDTPLGLLRVEVQRKGEELLIEYDAPKGMAVEVVE